MLFVHAYIRPRVCTGSEREHGRLLAVTEEVDEGLGDEEPDGDADRDGDHCGPDLRRAALCGDTACLGQARLYA